MFKNALVSVSDKTHLAEFLKPLVEKGLRVVSTGGTSKYLKENGIPVIEVAEQTGFPEVMDGRVRTLHPHIHMALLARIENSEDMALMEKYKLEPFDLVIGNLYPFSKYKDQYKEKNLDERELSEYIDIGGPALLRAAAKNFYQTTVICDPKDYGVVSEMVGATKEVALETRRKLAAKLFSHISHYDSMIANTLSGNSLDQETQTFAAQKFKELRYGENPQQKALWLSSEKKGLHCAEFLNGKELSYNNILDLDSALDLAILFKTPACVAVKHNNACGVATDEKLLNAVQKGLLADPVSVFGGIVAINREVTEKEVHELNKVFLECVIAPSYSPAALEILKAKKNLRVLEYDFKNHKKEKTLKSIAGGYLLQMQDCVEATWNPDWKIVGETPSDELREDLLFAWKVCAQLKSNAIAICANGQSLGLGMGQVNRVDSVTQAIERMQKFHPQSKSPVLASDAFFPFADSIELAYKAGVRWIIQPGGSVKDEEVIQKAQKLSVNLILTGKRHFRH